VSTLPMDLRNTALIAGAAMAISTLWSFGNLFLSAMTTGRDPLVFSLGLVPLFLLGVPLPVFLLLLYRAGVLLTVSSKLRSVALVLAVIRCVDFVVSGMSDWLHGIHSNQSPVHAALSDAIDLTAMFTFILFLFALSRQSGAAEESPAVGSGKVKNAAMVAVCARGLDLIMVVGVGVMMYPMEKRLHLNSGFTSPQAIARNALFALPGVIAPLIVYVSLRTATFSKSEG
jgi:hypothetical protein